MPSFAIEVPGEANPLNEDLLVRTLHSAASSDPHQIQTGTKQLQQWERTDGYYKHLQSAYIDTRLPVELRYLAIIQLKNGIDKYWRKTATNAVSKDDKDAIRSRLIQSSLQESEDGLSLQRSHASSTRTTGQTHFPRSCKPSDHRSLLYSLRERCWPCCTL